MEPVPVSSIAKHVIRHTYRGVYFANTIAVPAGELLPHLGAPASELRIIYNLCEDQTTRD